MHRLMERAREPLLAGACLAVDQHGCDVGSIEQPFDDAQDPL